MSSTHFSKLAGKITQQTRPHPVDPEASQIFYDTETNVLNIRISSAWYGLPFNTSTSTSTSTTTTSTSSSTTTTSTSSSSSTSTSTSTTSSTSTTV